MKMNKFNETEFKSLLINRSEIEKALDVKIDLNQNEDSKKPYAENASQIQIQTQIETLQAELQQARNQIEQLRQENAQLLSQKQSVINYEDYSIYGHTSEEIKIMFKTIDRFWKNCDLSQPDTIANKEIIIDWIMNTYGKNKSTAERIQTLIRPERARETGRKS